MMKKFILLTLILGLIISKSFSQDRWINIDYSTSNTGDNGLIGKTVACIFKDHLGKIWFGTPNGISIWDGTSWKSYTTNEGLIVNDVNDIIEDNDNNIWIGYGSYVCGVSKLTDGKWEHINTSNGLAHNQINSIFKDKDGYLWFATNGGISKYKNNAWVNYTTENGLPTSIITEIIQDNNGDLLIGTIDKGLLKFDGTTFSEFCWEANSKAFILSLLCDSKGVIWAGGYGLHKFDGQWSTVDPFPADQYGYVVDIAEEANGNLYFATNEGLSVLKSNGWQYFDTSNGLPDNSVWMVFAGEANKIMVATDDGVGIYDGLAWTSIQTSSGGLIQNEVNYIFKDSKKNIWICTQGGISCFKDYSWTNYSKTQNDEKIEWVSCGLEDKNGNLWFGTVHGIFMLDQKGWHIYKQDQGWVQNVVEDKKGHLWFASWEGVYKYDGESWKTYTTENGMLSNGTNGLFIDSQDNIWIGTSKGVSKWNGESFVNYPIDESLTGGTIYSFTEDNKRKIIATTVYGLITLEDNNWIRLPNAPVCWFYDSYIDMNNTQWFASIHNGLYKYDGENWSNYTIADGLISNNIFSIFREKNNGVFWFGTENGISSLIPDIVAHVSEHSKKTSSSKNSYSINLQCEGITQPFQFSINGSAFVRNGGVFENLLDGYYTISITNAYDTIKIENIKIGNPITDIVTESAEEITVFPNPSSGVFYFKNLSGKLELYDLQGRILLEKIISGEDNSINISEFNRGIYIISINGKRGLIIKN